MSSCTALMRAVPILAAAKMVQIIHLREDGDERTGEPAVRYLAQNGVSAKVVEVQARSDDIGAEIVSQAQSCQANLIVMGGYGRSRMRELVLGGATRHLIRSAPLPVFLAH